MILRIKSFAASLLAVCLFQSVPSAAQSGSQELAWSVKYDPKTLDPAKVDDQATELVRYLTGGVLLRLNRRTQQVEPWLAERWDVSPDGKLVTFHLRDHLRFSDGSALTSADVAASLRRVLASATQAPAAEEFLDPAGVTISVPDPLTVKVQLPKRVVGIGKVFDEIAIEPANRPSEGRVTSGPFTVADWKHGESIRLQRNPNYWRHDSAGRALPYLASLRLDVLANREQDELRFVRGQYGVIESLPPEDFDMLAKRAPDSVRDMGPSLNTEQMWFNQSPTAPLPDWEKKWFTSRAFRMAVSQAIHRGDLARIAYNGHATPANGFISPANAVWYNRKLQPIPEDAKAALDLLQKDGFRKNGNTLVDSGGHPVRFSILTNAGNRAREKMASLIQQDLAALGMQVNVVTLDFPALIERLTKTGNYEAAMLGLSNVEPDPSAMMNVWLSSSPNHQWNPAEKTPATPWEAEIDTQMKLQAAAAKDIDRKRAVDRVQEIVYEQQPFIYLVYPNMLYAASSKLTGVELSVLQPGVVSNIDAIQWKAAKPVSAPALRVRLSAGYGKTRVLDGVELDLEQGECLGLAGPSGAGKSTLVLALLGLLPWRRGWATGEVTLGGRNLLALSEHEARQVRGREIALVPQSPLSALNPALSLRTHFRESWRAHCPDSAGLTARVTELMRQMHLPADDAFLNRKPGQISVGQAQRVVLAQALLHRPSVLIADEPTSALDPATQVEVLRLLRQVQQQEGTTLLYISHDLVSILQLCERVAVLTGGKTTAAHLVRELGYSRLHPALRIFIETLPAPIEVILDHLKSPLDTRTKVSRKWDPKLVEDLKGFELSRPFANEKSVVF